MTTWVSILGDSADPNTHSGMQYYFHRCLLDRESEARAMNLSTNGLKVTRLMWGVTHIARLQLPGGFQYSRSFLEAIWSRHAQAIRATRVVNFFQLYAPSVVARADVERWFYLDLSLRQLFDFYGLGRRLGARDRADAIDRERAGYHAATGLIAMSEFAAKSFRDDYGVPSTRLHIVPPGANIDAESLVAADRVGPPTRPAGAAVRIGFVGKDWKRKGLDRLIRALTLARSDGNAIELRVIGCSAEYVPRGLRVPWIDWTGSVDKRHEASRFVTLLRDCDLGCLLSRADASPIALREFHALGIPTLATDVGGCREMAPADASVFVATDASDHSIAMVITGLATDRSRLSRLKSSAWERRGESRWAAAVDAIASLFSSQTLNTTTA